MNFEMKVLKDAQGVHSTQGALQSNNACFVAMTFMQHSKMEVLAATQPKLLQIGMRQVQTESCANEFFGPSVRENHFHRSSPKR